MYDLGIMRALRGQCDARSYRTVVRKKCTWCDSPLKYAGWKDTMAAMSRAKPEECPAGQTKQVPQNMVGNGARVLLVAAAAFIVLFGLKYTREMTAPIVLAAFLAIVSYPIIDLMRRGIRLPHWLAVTCTVIVDMAVLFGLVCLMKFLTADMKATLQGNFMPHLKTRVNELLDLAKELPFHEQLHNLFDSQANPVINPQQIIAFSQSITGQVLSFMSVTVLVLILMTFMLGEAPLFRRNLDNLPSRQGKLTVLDALRGVQKYLIIKTLASVSTGLLAWALCHCMEVPFAFMWGFVACVLNFIPTIGSIVAAIPPVLLALVMRDWGSMFIVAGGYLGINFAIGNGIEPLFLGKQFGMATSMVLISVIVWGWVWGPIGMLLAVPITMFLKLAMEHSTDLRWMASIIDDAAHSDPQNELPTLDTSPDRHP